MLSSEEWRGRQARMEEALALLAPAFTEQDTSEVRDWFDAGEHDFGMDQFVRILLMDRIPLDDRSYELVTSILQEITPVPGGRLTYLSNPGAVARLLDRAGEPRRRRGMPALRSGAEGPFLPPGRTPRLAAEQVLARRPDPMVRLSNGRHWRATRIDGVEVGVLTTADGEIRAIVPGERDRSPRPFSDPARATAAELLAFCVRRNCNWLQGLLHTDQDEADVLGALYRAGEFDELGDALIARADHEWPQLDPPARSRARALLRSYDLPVEGCRYLDDRVLARWTG